MEFIEGSTLKDVVQQQKPDERKVRKIVFQLLHFFQVIHPTKAHLNIHPDSVHIDEQANIKLTGFTNFQIDQQGQNLYLEDPTIFPFNPSFTHPFLLAGKTNILAQKADLWSLGMLLLYMLKGEDLFESNTKKFVLQEVTPILGEIEGETRKDLNKDSESSFSQGESGSNLQVVEDIFASCDFDSKDALKDLVVTCLTKPTSASSLLQEFSFEDFTYFRVDLENFPDRSFLCLHQKLGRVRRASKAASRRFSTMQSEEKPLGIWSCEISHPIGMEKEKMHKDVCVETSLMVKKTFQWCVYAPTGEERKVDFDIENLTLQYTEIFAFRQRRGSNSGARRRRVSVS